MSRRKKQELGAATQIVNVDVAAIEALLARLRAQLAPADFELVKALCESFVQLTKLVRAQGTTLARLRRLCGTAASEKMATVLAKDQVGTDGGDADAGGAPAAVSAAAGPAAPPPPRQRPKGHGRVPVEDYAHATHIAVAHDAEHRPGQPCPACTCGKLYPVAEPGRFLRIFGQAALTAVCWDCERVRCGACGAVYTAPAPPAAQGPKYDETAASMMALMRYGTGVPLNRLDQLQRDLETPVPASTQWDVVHERVGDVAPVYQRLLRLSAQGSIVHNDDTYMRILALMGKRRAELLRRGALADPERTGLFTTGVVSITASGPIALFFTGRQHAGENLAAVLGARAAGAAPPLLMSDALDRNLPKGHPVDWANCLCHGRRNVVDEVANYPTECRHILEELAKVFEVEARCRQLRLCDDERLRVHQRDSGPVMAALEPWLRALADAKRIEPNSGMGQAVHYLLKRWERFNRFLHVPGAPLENNLCERALKKAIRHRNNSLFYKTQHGADVGDIYMTLIHTAELHRVNPFEYLTALMRHAKSVAAEPASWLPWTYRETLARLELPGPAPCPRVPVAIAPPPPGPGPRLAN